MATLRSDQSAARGFIATRHALRGVSFFMPVEARRSPSVGFCRARDIILPPQVMPRRSPCAARYLPQLRSVHLWFWKPESVVSVVGLVCLVAENLMR